MAAEYLHGVETIEFLVGTRPVRVSRTGVIALIGIAPKGPRQTLTLVLNTDDAAQFGSELPGFNIPEALNVLLRNYGAAPILVVNVFDPATHLVTVSNEAKTVDAQGRFRLAHAPISDLVITTSGGSPTTLVKDTDYSVDDFGRVRILRRTTYPTGTNLVAGYKRLDPTLVTGSHIIGGVASETEIRTGLELFDTAYNLFGFNPRILIAPRYATLSSVANALITKTDKYRAEAYISAPVGTTVAGAVAGRGPSGSINFTTSNQRVVLLYPNHQRTDPNLDTPGFKLIPAEVHEAGLRNWVDRNFGFWFSTSNNEYIGIEGMERTITWNLTDPNTEANLLNSVGIKTTAIGFGTGYRSWGNHSASYASETHPVSFMAVRRAADTIFDSIQNAMLPYMDKPLNTAIIDEILETANGFIRTMIQRGAAIQGSRVFVAPGVNTNATLAAGNMIFDIDIMTPVPLERVTFRAFLNSNLLENILPA